MESYIERIDTWAGMLGPNVYLQAAAIVLVFVVAGKIADTIVSRMVAEIASRSKTNIADELVALVHRPVFMSFVLAGLGLATLRIGMAATVQYITLAVLKSIAIVIWYGFVRRVAALLLSALARRGSSGVMQPNIVSLIDTVLKIALFALTIFFILEAWKIDPSAWLASAGIVGLALSFAAKDTLSNLFAGVSIIIDAPYKIGDFITLESGERGQVTNIGLRSTRILTRDDVEITVPNAIIGNNKILNEAGGPNSNHRIRVAIGTAYGSDIDKVIACLERVADEHPEVCRSPERRVRFRSFGDSSLNFELLCWIELPVNRGRMLHELNCAVYKAFAHDGIEIPFPQRDLHVRSMPAMEKPAQ